MHVELLFAYVSAIALLIAIILYPSVRTYVKENLCLKGLWPCVARAAPWLMVALVPAVDAMESHVYPLECCAQNPPTSRATVFPVFIFLSLQLGLLRAQACSCYTSKFQVQTPITHFYSSFRSRAFSTVFFYR